MKEKTKNRITYEKTKESRGSKTLAIAKIALSTSIMCILGPFTLPIGPVPISFTNLAIYLALYMLGWKRGTISYLVYVLIGLAGLPVFSSYGSGFAKLFGPTGGYIIGFIFMAVIAGLFIDKFTANNYLCITGMAFGMIVCYAFGTSWLAYAAHMKMPAAIAAGIIPFIIGDSIKIILASFVGANIRKQLIKAKLF